MLFYLGLVWTACAFVYLLAIYLRTRKQSHFPAYGWLGLTVIGAAEILLYFQVPPVPVFFTPIVWTGYILAVDAAVYSVRGRSLLLSEPQAFLWMAVLSIFLWLLFEAYNLRLVNWTYVGLPRNDLVRYFGYGWAFATIWPCVLETSEFLLATQFRDRGEPPPPPRAERRIVPWVALGIVLVIVPVVVPRYYGVYMFGLVWLGFIFLVDPLNRRARRPSLGGDLAEGYSARLWSLLLAGAFCGFFWEFWNYWATGKWLYIFPILEQYHVFEMPVLGYFGFPAFALEIFVLYVFVTGALGLPSYLSTPDSGAGPETLSLH